MGHLGLWRIVERCAGADMRPYRRTSHTRHDLKVHLIWVTKYRYAVMNAQIGERIRELIRQYCDANDIQIIKGRVSKDHIHLYLSYPPKFSVSDLVRRLKGRTSKKIQEEFPQLGRTYWGRHFWAIGYGAFSAGHVSDEMIQHYLDHHEQRPDGDEDFVVEE